MNSVKRLRLTYVGIDLLMSALAILLFNIARFHILGLERTVFFNLYQYLHDPKIILENLLMPFGMLGIFWLSGYYNQPYGRSRLQELSSTFFSTALCAVLIFFIFLLNDMTKALEVNYLLLLLLFGLIFVCVYIPRLTVTEMVRRSMTRHAVTIPTIVIGASKEADKFLKGMAGSRQTMGYEVRAIVALPDEENIPFDIPTYKLDELEEVVRHFRPEKAVIAPQNFNDREMLRIIERLFPLGVDVKITPGTFNFLTSSIRLSDIFGEPFVNLTSSNMTDMSKNVKRTLDVLLSSMAMLLLCPLYLAVWCAVKLDSKGPAIYRQERIGYRRKPFDILKFRTMKVSAEADGPALSSENDSRVTRVGKVLRKYRLDELPQFLNVLKGDMSLVGPRPERMFFIEKIVEKAPYYTLLHQVRPGITSWGMVKYGYARSVEEMIARSQYDLIYLQNMSLNVDFKIIIYTLKTVLTGKGM